MADQTNANINVNINATGAKELLNASEATANNYTKVAAALEKAASGTNRVPKAVVAARTEAYKENEEYGKVRGAVGTGAASRDFAQQAQGLGGVVKLYATVAANLFAVSAAFTALSRAADTSNMIKGLDQLGAAAGKNLGYLSKQLAMATDGAISIRESMEAVAKTSAAGLTNDQILRLGAVAKNASQALGVAMPDAISRLSRGISKIEPELLDELGLFTKLDKAVTDYARSVGKTVTSLTDFERRQAYATAVLAEGEAKFSEMDIEANPYSKLLASLQNTATEFLYIINDIITPAVKFFANNTGALGAALALVGTKLLQQGIPALSAWKQNLLESAEAAKKSAGSIYRVYGEKSWEAIEAGLKLPELSKATKEAEKDVQKAGEALALARNAAIEQGLAKGNSNIAKFLKDSANIDKTLSDDAKKSLEASLKRAEKGTTEELKIKREGLAALAEAEKNHTIALQKQSIARQTQKEAEIAAEIEANKKMVFLSGEWQRAKIAQYASDRAARLNILQSVQTTTDQLGMGAGIEVLREQLGGNKTMGAVSKFRTALSGAFVVAATGATKLIAAISPFLILVPVVVGAFKLLDGWLTKNAKEAKALEESLSALDSAGENLSRTLSRLNKIKDPLERFSPQNIAAKRTAVKGLTDAIGEVIVDTQASMDKMGNWDKFWDNMWGLVNRGSTDKLADAIGKNLNAALDALEKGPEYDKYLKELAKILGSGTDRKSILKAIENNKDSPEILQKIAEASVKVGDAANLSGQKVLEFNNTLDNLTKTARDIKNSFLPTDNISKFGLSMQDASMQLSKALNDPSLETGLSALKKAAESDAFLSIFPQELSSEIVRISAAINNNAKALDSETKSTEQLKIELEKLEKTKKRALELDAHFKSDEAGGGLRATGIMTQPVEDEREMRTGLIKDSAAYFSDLEAKIKSVNELINKGNTGLRAEADSFRQKFRVFADEGFIRGAELVSSRLAAEAAKINNATTSTIAGYLGETQSGLALRLEAEKKVLAGQIAQITAQKNLAVKLEENSLALLSATNEYKKAEYVKANPTDTTSDKYKAFEQTEIYLKERSRLLSANLSRKDLLGMTKGLSEAAAAEQKTGNAPSATLLATLGASQDAFKFAQAMEAINIQLATLGNQLKSVNIKGKIESPRIDENEKAAERTRNIQNKTAQSAALGLLSNTTTESGIEATKEKANLDIEIKRLQIANDNAALIAKQEELERLKNIAAKEGINISLIQADIQKEIEKAKQIGQTRSIELETERFNLLKQVQDAEFSYANFKRNNEADLANIILEGEQKSLTMQQEKLSVLNTEKIIYGDTYANLKEILDLRAIDLEYSREKAALDKDNADKMMAYLQQYAAASLQVQLLNKKEAEIGGLNTQDSSARNSALRTQAELQKQIDKQSRSYIQQSDLLEDQVDHKKQVLKLTSDSLKIQEKWNKALKAFENIANSIENVFGSIGEEFTKSAKIFIDIGKQRDELAKQDKDRKQAILDLGKTELVTAEQISKYKALQKDDAEKTKEAKLQEIGLLAQEVGAVKNVFSEKTAAHKALMALETGIHMARLAMYVVENKAKLAGMATDLAALPVKGAKAIMEALSAPFPIGFATGAAMAAVVASLIASVGGSGSPSVSGGSIDMTETRQKTQGTGTYHDSEDNKQDSGYGVFGDPEEKLEGINKSLDILKNTNLKALPLYNKMVYLLSSINAGINDTAKAIFSSDLNSGRMFDYLERTSTSGIKGFFGKSTSTEVTDYGIAIGPNTKDRTPLSFNDLVKGLGLYQYADTTTTENNSGILGLFGGSKTNSGTIFEELDPIIKTSLTKVLGNAQTAILEIASDFGTSSAEAMKILDRKIFGSPFYASLEGLKGEDLEKELSAFINNFIDIGLGSILGDILGPLQDFGEDLLTTATRIINNTKIVQQALLFVGLDLEKGLTEMFTSWFESSPAEAIAAYGDIGTAVKKNSIWISDSLIEMAGGTEAFVDSANFYFDNFLSEADQLKFKTKSVTDEIDRLKAYAETSGRTELTGMFDGLDTVEEFNNIVKAINYTTESGGQLYTWLMKLAPSFIEVYNPLEDAAKETADNIQELTIQLYRLQGRTDEALALDRNKILESLISDGEKLLQKQIWTLEDENILIDLNIEKLSAEGYAYQVLIKTREQELKSLTEAQRTAKLAVYAAEDKAKTEELSVRLLREQGRVTEALVIERKKELLQYSETDGALVELLKAYEDANTLIDLNIEKLNAEGAAYESLIATRALELRSLTDVERVLKLAVYAAQDKTKTDELSIRLLKAQGKGAEALALERQKELLQYSATDRALLELIWAYEDANQAQEDYTTGINDITDTLKTSIDKLKEYKDSLLIGDKSPLSTADKYVEVGNRIQEYLSIILKPAKTESELAAQSKAIDDLTESSELYLSLSRKLFASSTPYETDFAWINDIIDTALNATGAQLSTEEKILEATNKTNDTLLTISDHASNIADKLDAYNAAKAADNPVDTLTEYADSLIPGIGPDLLKEIEPLIKGTPLYALLTGGLNTKDSSYAAVEGSLPLSTTGSITTDNLVTTSDDNATNVAILNDTTKITEAIIQKSNEIIVELKTAVKKLTDIELAVNNSAVAIVRTSENNTLELSKMLEDTSNNYNYTQALLNSAAIV